PTAPRSAALYLPMPHTPGHLHRRHAPPDGFAALSGNSLAPRGFASWLLARRSTSCQDCADLHDEGAAETRLSRVPAVQVTLRDTPEGLAGALPPSHSRSLRQSAETGRWSPERCPSRTHSPSQHGSVPLPGNVGPTPSERYPQESRPYLHTAVSLA